MTARPAFLLLLSLTTIALSAPVETEPDDPNAIPEPSFEMPKLNFEISSIRVDPLNIRHQGDLPKYRADIVLPDTHVRHGSIVPAIMRSPLAQNLSPTQKDFLETYHHQSARHMRHVGNDWVEVSLYAVSVEDAKTTVLALLDTLIAEARQERAKYERMLEEQKQRRDAQQSELAEKQKRFKEATSQFEQQWKNTHPLLDGGEAAQLAKETILQMDKESNMLDIELAGIEAKLRAIDMYLSTPATIDKHLSKSKLSPQIAERLETTRIEQMIELHSAEARRQTIEKIRTTERQFYNFYIERQQLKAAMPQLREILARCQQRIGNLTGSLKQTSSRLMPPQVVDNKVTIYPIRAQDVQN